MHRELTGENALVIFAMKNNLNAKKLICSLPNANLNCANNLDWTSLMYVSDMGILEVAKFLTEVPEISINSKNKYDETALMRAVVNELIDVVEHLSSD